MAAAKVKEAAPAPPSYLAGVSLEQPQMEPLGHYLDVTPERYVEHKPGWWQSVRFRFKPLGRVPRNRVLEISLDGRLPLQTRSSVFGSSELSLVDVTQALRTAAHDPRVNAVLLTAGDVSVGTATLMEVRRAMDYYRQSGKPLWGFAPRMVDMNVLYVLGGCSKVVTVPEAGVSLTGFSLQVDFYRGVFDKIGLEPQVRRIGEYKSFGDTFARTSMSDAQRETMTSLLDSVAPHKLGQLARDAGRGVGDLQELMDQGPVTAPMLQEFGLVHELMYDDELYRKLRSVVRGSPGPDFVDPAKVYFPVEKYLRRTKMNKVEGVPGSKGDKTIAVIVAEGSILDKAGDDANPGDLVVDQFEEQIVEAMKDKDVDGVVVRINSPGGDALASDLMWRQAKRVSMSGKPIVASICNVAASGGYYIAMGCDKIVCDEQSITGSIGVVQAKFALGKLLERVGLNVERLSRGRFAELFAIERGFTPDEDQYWSQTAMQAYEDFVTKAASSRGMDVGTMHRRAQGRVWTGAQAKALGLVDELGGLSKAVEVCRALVDTNDRAEKELRRKTKRLSKKSKAALKAMGLKLPITRAGLDCVSDLLDVYSEKHVGEGERGAKVEAAQAAVSELMGAVGQPFRDGTRGRAAGGEQEAEEEEEEEEDVGATKIKYIDPPEPGLKALLRSLPLFSASTGLGMTSPLEGGSAVQGLGKLAGSLGKLNQGQPMAIMDDSVGRALPGMGVPENLRSLGMGPLGHYLLSQAPDLAGILVEEVQRLGISALLSAD